MADIWTKAKRSEVMGRIRGRGNRTTEVRLAAIFRAHGITGWRRQHPLPVRPDFAFPAGRLAGEGKIGRRMRAEERETGERGRLGDR